MEGFNKKKKDEDWARAQKILERIKTDPKYKEAFSKTLREKSGEGNIEELPKPERDGTAQ